MMRNRMCAKDRMRASAGEIGADAAPGVSPVRALLCAGLLSMALVAAGCGTVGGPERQYYILQVTRQGPPAQNPIDASLQVHRFNVDAAFATRSMVYRLGEFRYEADYYHQFLISPNIMITEQTRDWLAGAGLFRRVLPRGSRISPDYTLEANVTALYGDFSNESAPTAVIEIRFFLVGESDDREHVVFAKTYRAATPVASKTAEVFAGALTESLTEILTHLEADLPQAFAKMNAPGNVSAP